jgi:hypothetical protein
LGRKEAGTFTIPLKGKKTDQNDKETEQEVSPSVQAVSFVTDENVCAHMVFLIPFFLGINFPLYSPCIESGYSK